MKTIAAHFETVFENFVGIKQDEYLMYLEEEKLNPDRENALEIMNDEFEQIIKKLDQKIHDPRIYVYLTGNKVVQMMNLLTFPSRYIQDCVFRISEILIHNYFSFDKAIFKALQNILIQILFDDYPVIGIDFLFEMITIILTTNSNICKNPEEFLYSIIIPLHSHQYLSYFQKSMESFLLSYIEIYFISVSNVIVNLINISPNNSQLSFIIQEIFTLMKLPRFTSFDTVFCEIYKLIKMAFESHNYEAINDSIYILMYDTFFDILTHLAEEILVDLMKTILKYIQNSKVRDNMMGIIYMIIKIIEVRPEIKLDSLTQL